ncbi:MAG: diphthine--ammonia ligase [Firmicutes bacterium]|nr:diphthine--ammonia ligase [Bacillota bacterium]
MAGRAFFCSWSGGKDSALALYYALRQGGAPRCLLTMLDETGARSHSHRLPRSLLEKQGESLGLPVVFRAASWSGYEAEFLAALREIEAKGVQAGVFGDIDLESHRAWVHRTCAAAGITPYHPLWKRARRELLEEFIRLGFKATIVAVDGRRLDRDFLGRDLDPSTLADLERAGIDPAGEEGEYHTVVTNGPIFAFQVRVREKGRVGHDGYWFLDLEVCPE